MNTSKKNSSLIVPSVDGVAATNAATRAPTAPPSEVRSRSGFGKIILIVLLLFMLVAGILWHRDGQKQQLAKETQELAILHVSMAHPTSGEPDNNVGLPGNLMAYSDAPIYA